MAFGSSGRTLGYPSVQEGIGPDGPVENMDLGGAMVHYGFAGAWYREGEPEPKNFADDEKHAQAANDLKEGYRPSYAAQAATGMASSPGSGSVRTPRPWCRAPQGTTSITRSTEMSFRYRLPYRGLQWAWFCPGLR